MDLLPLGRILRIFAKGHHGDQGRGDNAGESEETESVFVAPDVLFHVADHRRPQETT